VGSLENIEAAHAYAQKKYGYGQASWQEFFEKGQYSTPVEVQLALPPQQPNPSTIAGQAAAAKAAGAGTGKHIRTAAGMRKFKGGIGNLIIPHGRHFIKGAPGHWAKGWISQEKWVANQWKKHPHNPNLAHHAIQAGSHKLVQAGEHAVAAHHAVEVHVPKGTDLDDPVAVKNATKVLHHGNEFALLSQHGGLGKVQKHTESTKTSLKASYKPLPHGGVTKKSVGFEGQHTAWVPHDWQVYKADKPDSHLQGKWAKDPQGNWHLIHKSGHIEPKPYSSDPEAWAAKGGIVPDEGHPSAGASPDHIAPTTEPGHEPGKVDVGGVAATKDEIKSAIAHLQAAQSTNVKGPLKSKGHPLAAMDYMGISKVELEKHPELKVSAGTKQKHVGQVKLAVLHHLQGKLDQLSKDEAEAAHAKAVKEQVKAQAAHAEKLTPALKKWGGVEATKEQLGEAAQWLDATMGGKQSFKQAMNKTGNPLASADYMQAAKDYQKAHPASTKGWSTKKLMLESIKELQGQAAVADQQTGHDVAAYVHEHLASAVGTTHPLKEGWDQSAEGAIGAALFLSHKNKSVYHVSLSAYAPGVWAVSKMPPSGDKQHMLVTPDHKVKMVLAGGQGTHEYDEDHIAKIVAEWVNGPEKGPTPEEKDQALKELKDKLAPPEPEYTPPGVPVITKLKLPEPKPSKATDVYPSLKKPEPKPGFNVPASLSRFLDKKKPQHDKGIHYDTLPKTIREALLHSKNTTHPLYVGQVPHGGSTPETSWVHQFVKPSKGTYYKVHAMNFGGEWVPSMTKHVDGTLGEQVYSLDEIADIVQRGAKPAEVPDKSPPKLEDVLQKVMSLPKEEPSPEFGQGQVPTMEWVSQHEWPDIHAAVTGATAIPNNSSTDEAIAKALYMSDHFKSDRFIIPSTLGGWTSSSEHPKTGAFGAPSSWPNGYYHVTPDHQVIQVDKFGNEVALPPEAILEIANAHLKPQAKEPEPQQMVGVKVGSYSTQFPAGSKVYIWNPDSEPAKNYGWDANEVQYVEEPTGTWWVVTPGGGKSKTQAQKQVVADGTLVPYVPEGEKKEPEGKPVEVHIGGKLVHSAPPGTTLWYDATEDPTGSELSVYMKSPDGQWTYVKPSGKVETSWNSDESLNQGILSGEMAPYDQGAKQYAKDIGATKTEGKPKEDPPAVQQDIPVSYQGKIVGHAPAGSKVYWYDLGKAEEEHSVKYVQHPDGSWWSYDDKGKHASAFDYSGYAKDGSIKEVGTKSTAKADAPLTPVPEEKPKDIPVVTSDGLSKGMVPAGSKFYKFTDTNHTQWVYVQKPDGSWWRAQASGNSLSKLYSNPLEGPNKDDIKPYDGPTPEQIAHVEDLATVKAALDSGTVPSKLGQTSAMAYMAHLLASRSASYWHSEYIIHQASNGTWVQGYPPAGAEHYKLFPKTMTAEHIVPPSPSNETSVKTPVSFEEIKAAVNQHLVPNAVSINGKVYKHGYYYNPKGKAYLEIKKGHGGYYSEDKGSYAWHQVNGNVKYVTATYAEQQLEKNTEYHAVPKPQAADQVLKNVKFATTMEPGNWHLYSSKEASGVAQSHLTAHQDGSAVYHDAGLGDKTLPESGVEALLAGGTLLDEHGNTVVKPGVQPGQYHLFGSKGKSEQEMAALLEKLEKADPGDWAKHLHEFMGSAKHQLDPEPSKLWASWWNTKGKVTGQQQLDGLKSLVRELLLIPKQAAAKPAEVTFLKSAPDGIHSSKQVFSWTPNGWAKPYGGDLSKGWLDGKYQSSSALGDKIKAISAEFGNGKVVGTHVASMSKDQKLAWLKAWKSGDMASVFDIDASTGKVSPVHPGAPKNAVTHQVNWSPLDPSQVPATQVIEGEWTKGNVIMPKKEVNNYIIKMGFKNPEWLSEQQKLSLVGAHMDHDQDKVDLLTGMANADFEAGKPGKTNTPVWTEGLKPAKSYDSYLENQQSAYEWSQQATKDFLEDHKDELAPQLAEVAAKHGLPSSQVIDYGYGGEVVQGWMEDVHAKHVAEQSKPVWKKVDTGALPSHGHPVFKYVKTIPYTGEASNWFVKPAPKAGAEWRLDQEHAANMLGRALGFQTANSEITTIDGQTMQAQAEIKGSPLGQYTDMQPWSTFTPEQIADIAAEHLLDWTIANDDSSPNNLIKRDDGRIVGIDKGRAWGNMQWPGLAGDSSMDTMTKLIYTKLYDAIRKHEISKETADAAFVRIIKQARKMEATSDAKLRAILEAGFANRPGKYGDPKELIDETIKRKNSLEEDFTKLWAQVYADAGYAVGAADDPHAEGTPWGPVHGKAAHGVILFDDKGRIMLREPSNHYGGYSWTFSKGGANPGETPLETAIRETAEETKLKAHSVLGYVPGAFTGSTSAASYFYFGLKEHTTDAPEMDNGETWNVKWVTKAEAKKLIAQTESEAGKARDLKILDAAFEAHAASKAQGFPVMEAAAPGGAGTGLPEVPKAKLGASHGGVPLHSGFSEPDFMDHVHASKSFGQAAFFGGPDVEYGHFVVWKELDNKNADVIHGEGGARGAGLKALEAWAKKHVTGGSGDEFDPSVPDTQTVYEGTENLPGPAPAHSQDRAGLDGEVGFYNKIIKAARTVSRHAADKNFNAGVLQEMDSVKQQLTKLLEGIEHTDPSNEWAKEAKPAVQLYLDYIKQVETAKETSGTFKPGDLPRYLPPEKPKAEVKEEPKKTEVKVTMRSPWRPATSDTTNLSALSQEDGQLHTGGGKAGFEISGGKVFHIELPTGEWIDLYPGGSVSNETNSYGIPVAHFGHIKFQAVAEDGSASLERIREQLQEMGLPMEEATHEDMELYYWRHMYHVLHDRRDGPNGHESSSVYAKVAAAVEEGKKAHGVAPGTDLERGGLSPDDELAIWHKAWGNVTSEQHVQEFADNGGHLPHFKHYSLHDAGQAGGRPVWHRFDMDQKMVSGWKMPDHIFVTHPDKGAVRIIRSGGQYSKDFRFRHLGLNLNGQGNPPSTGATDFVFANLNSESGHVIANPRILAQTTNYGWNGDNWGRIWNRVKKSYFDPEKAAAWQGMETMFQGGWSLLDDIEAVRANSSSQRQQMIDELHSLGITTIRGLPVEDRIGTDNTWSAVKKKIREHWKAHPELLDPHYEPELTTEAGAQAAESGKAAAKTATKESAVKESAAKAQATAQVAAVIASTGNAEADKVLQDPANEVYANADVPGYHYVKLPTGDWKKIKPQGVMYSKNKDGVGGPTVNQYEKYILDGTFQLVKPAEAPKTFQQILDDPANKVYYSASGGSSQYVKAPDGTWHVSTDGGATHMPFKPDSSQSKVFNQSVEEGGLQLQAKPSGQPKVGELSADQVLSDVNNTVYTHSAPAFAGNKYVKDPQGNWHLINKKGVVTSYEAGSPGAEVADELAASGELNLLIEPGEGDPSAGAEAILTNKANFDIYTDPKVPGTKYAQSKNTGDWYLIKGGKIASYLPQGSAPAQDYDDLLSEGGLVQASAPIILHMDPALADPKELHTDVHGNVYDYGLAFDKIMQKQDEQLKLLTQLVGQ